MHGSFPCPGLDPGSVLYRDRFGHPLLSDMHRRACQAYSVHDPVRNIARRSTFIVDREGILRFGEIYPAGITPDPEKLLAALRALPGPA